MREINEIKADHKNYFNLVKEMVIADFKGNLFDLHLTYALLLKVQGEKERSDVAIQNAIKIYKNDQEFQDILKSFKEIDL
jgi:hypothetical protein